MVRFLVSSWRHCCGGNHQRLDMNIITKLCLCLAAALMIGGQAQAQTVVGLHTVSIHAPDRGQTNANYGLYMRAGSGLELGAYRNSIDRPGVYLGQQFELAKGAAGALGLQVGAAYGYQKKCAVKTTVTPKKVTHESYSNGDTKTTTSPEKTEKREECKGFSRGAITPMAGLTYTAPFAIMGITPRLQFLPPFGKHAAVAHLTLERAL